MKIFYQSTPKTNLVVELENHKDKFITELNLSDAIMVEEFGLISTEKFKKYQTFIWLDLFHACEDAQKYYQICAKKFNFWKPSGKLFIISQYQQIRNLPDLGPNIKILFYDIMFNRQKAFYSNFPFAKHFHHNEALWYWGGNHVYEINHWPIESQHRNKIFLSVNRLWEDRENIRSRLQHYLEKYQHMGYLAINRAKVSNNIDSPFYSHKSDPRKNGLLWFDVTTGQVVCFEKESPVGYNYNDVNVFGFTPVHINYFEDSFISIYGETVEWGDSIFVSEKTLTPLIQGHFILPFGVNGLIDTIKSMGFELPYWIDYSYDLVENYQDRAQKYLDEIDRLLSKSHDWWIAKRNKSLHILFHNRSVFWNTPYNQLYNLLVQNNSF